MTHVESYVPLCVGGSSFQTDEQNCSLGVKLFTSNAKITAVIMSIFDSEFKPVNLGGGAPPTAEFSPRNESISGSDPTNAPANRLLCCFIITTVI